MRINTKNCRPREIKNMLLYLKLKLTIVAVIYHKYYKHSMENKESIIRCPCPFRLTPDIKSSESQVWAPCRLTNRFFSDIPAYGEVIVQPFHQSA